MLPTLALSKKVFTSESTDGILCYYVDTTRLIQVVQLANSPGKNFEKVMFPGQRLLFEAAAEAQLKIQTGLGLAGSHVLKDEIFCYSLRVIEEEDSDFD
jgi:hypothetical protein